MVWVLRNLQNPLFTRNLLWHPRKLERKFDRYFEKRGTHLLQLQLLQLSYLDKEVYTLFYFIVVTDQ